MEIEKIAALPKLKQKIRVAAYARVSSGKDAMLHSLSQQVSYYNNYIQRHNDWMFVGVYSDEAITGTKEDRAGFQRMLADAKKGLIDLVITKSISRFARNTVTLLKSVRALKDLNVGVYFEEQNINTLSGSGELMITILGSFAQEESKSASDNQKWRIKANFEAGIPWGAKLYGYKFVKDHLKVIPEEAKVIQKMTDYFLEGLGSAGIARRLTEEGILTRAGKAWGESSIRVILGNYYYTGNMVLQTGFRENHITKKRVNNNGEKPKYVVEEAHEAIIPIDTFNKIQEELKRREAISNHSHGPTITPFSKMIVCGKCGCSYKRKTTRYKHIWCCRTNVEKGASLCSARMVPEDVLYELSKEVLNINEFDEDLFKDKIKQIKVLDNNEVVFILSDDTEVLKCWTPKSRSEAWTKEKRELARQREIMRRSTNAKDNSNTTED